MTVFLSNFHTLVELDHLTLTLLCCFAADGQEMYQDSQRLCIAMHGIIISSFNLLFCDFLDRVAAYYSLDSDFRYERLSGV